MLININIFGEINKTEEKILVSCAKNYPLCEFRLSFVRNLYANDLKQSVCDGIISFLPCTPEILRKIYSNLPVESEKAVSFYQFIKEDTYPEACYSIPSCEAFRYPVTGLKVANIFRNILERKELLNHNSHLMEEVLRHRKQKYQLLSIGTAISMRNELSELLETILQKSRDVLKADAGSIYIRERINNGRDLGNTLRFMVSQNDSVDLKGKTKQFTIAIDQNTIAGYVADTGELLNIEDVYELNGTVPYRFGKDFDKKFSYRMKSMITVPLTDLDGDVVGVMQLMNKKNDADNILASSGDVLDYVMSFTRSDEEFIASIASLVAVSIERARLYEQREQLFEGFLNSSIAAVDERDRVTSGHSRRVMGYAMAFADAVNITESGPFKDTTIEGERKRQFKFAALLHDIGKIGVPEYLLNKETRLPLGEFNVIMSRFDFIKHLLIIGERQSVSGWSSIEDVESDKELLIIINNSGWINDENYKNLNTICKKTYVDVNGKKRFVIEAAEKEALSIRKGNLTDSEREKINSHTRSTKRILSKIPWTAGLADVPLIAAQHHEKLDGSGYPEGLKEGDVSLEGKILSVVDIYEALVAQDRSYKPAMPPDKALKILEMEVESGHLDRDIVDFFKKQNIWKIFIDQIPSS